MIDAETLEGQQQIKMIIEEAQRLRGWLANSYAQIEYLLGDLIVRSLTMPEYEQLGSTLPHDAPRRIKRARHIIEAGGWIGKFSQELNEILDNFEKKHETRNLLAHGFCEFLYTPDGDAGMRFSKWHYQPDRQDARLQRTFRLNDLQREQTELTALASKAVELFFRIHDDLGLVGTKDGLA